MVVPVVESHGAHHGKPWHRKQFTIAESHPPRRGRARLVEAGQAIAGGREGGVERGQHRILALTAGVLGGPRRDVKAVHLRDTEHPPREEYHPTARGGDSLAVLHELIRWGQRHVAGTANRPPAAM